MASTASGWQYAVPNDTLVAWPAVSQAVADKLEIVLAGKSVGEQVLSSGTFTTAAAVNLSNVLSNTYPFYSLYIYSKLGVVGNTTLNLRFRENTTDVTAANYAIGSYYAQVTGTNGTYSSNGSGTLVNLMAMINTRDSGLKIDIHRMNATQGLVTWQAYDSHNNFGIFGGASNWSMTNFNGLSFYPNAATFTGYYILTGRKA